MNKTGERRERTVRRLQPAAVARAAADAHRAPPGRLPGSQFRSRICCCSRVQRVVQSVRHLLAPLAHFLTSIHRNHSITVHGRSKLPFLSPKLIIKVHYPDSGEMQLSILFLFNNMYKHKTR